MDVLVTGGTGFIGRHLCVELVDRGHDATALARNPDDATVPDGVDTVAGDVREPDTLTEAFAGHDAVVNLVALSPLFEPRGGNELHDEIHRLGTEHCIALAESNDVHRFLQLSALGADPNGNTHYIRAKGRAEELVRGSALDWTIVRPSVIFGDGGEFLRFTRLLTPPLLAALPGGGRTRFQPIHVGDFVPLLADALGEDSHVGATYEIGGPEVLTLADVARLVRRARGQSVRIIPVPMALAKVGLTIAGLIPGFPMGPDQYRSLQFDNTTTANDIDVFGLEAETMTTVAEYLDIEAV